MPRAWIGVVLMMAVAARASSPVEEHHDQLGDHVIRETDAGGLGLIDPQLHRLIDLRRIRIGNWIPVDSSMDLFEGVFDANGPYIRLDIEVAGVVCPPGETDPLRFNPFVFGDNPIFGFVEIDVDRDKDTGGELLRPDMRYLGNVARFGGKPDDRPDLQPRVAIDDSAFDGDFLTDPGIERHGEEFHFALLGRELGFAVSEIEGDADMVFEAGETWHVFGHAFHRAHGFDELTLGAPFAPPTVVQFRHDIQTDTTWISLVFLLRDRPAVDDPCRNGANLPTPPTVLGALEDLAASACFLKMFPSGRPEEVLIQTWGDRDPSSFLESSEWRVTALLGTSYLAPVAGGERFVWTDVYPDVHRGDVDGNGARDSEDVALIENDVLQNDGIDGIRDGQVVIQRFSNNFSMFDINYDGVVDGLDAVVATRTGDVDLDGDVDLHDFAEFQVCASVNSGMLDPNFCPRVDFDADMDVGIDDLGHFLANVTGPDDD